MSLAFLYPGQGSQVKGMGLEVFPRFPELLRQADELLGYSLSELCLNDSEEKLNQTQYTQPALYLVSYLEGLARIEDGQSPKIGRAHV